MGRLRRQLYNKVICLLRFRRSFHLRQTLSESVKLVDNALLVVSIPASQTEIGGDGGKQR